MISGSFVVPFQKGPCGEGGRTRGFLLPLLEEASVVVLVLLLIFLFLNSPLLFSQHKNKQNKKFFEAVVLVPHGEGDDHTAVTLCRNN